MNTSSVSAIYSTLGLSMEKTSSDTNEDVRCSYDLLNSERTPNGKTYYYLFDTHDSMVGMTDSSDNDVDRYKDDPFGAKRGKAIMKNFLRKSRIVYGLTVISSLFASLFVVFALSQVKPAAGLTSRLHWRRRERPTPVSASPSSSVHIVSQHAPVSPEVEAQPQPQQVETRTVTGQSPEAIEYQRRLAQVTWEREQRFYEPDWD